MSYWQSLEIVGSIVIVTSLLLEMRLYDNLYGVDSIPNRISTYVILVSCVDSVLFMCSHVGSRSAVSRHICIYNSCISREIGVMLSITMCSTI
jgi:hypothetical protein